MALPAISVYITAIAYGTATGVIAYGGYKLVEAMNERDYPGVEDYYSGGLISGSKHYYPTISKPAEDGSYIITKNDPGAPKSNVDQNKQADDAKKEIEKKLGRKLSPREHDQFHDHVTGQGYGYHELVEEGYWLFNGS